MSIYWAVKQKPIWERNELPGVETNSTHCSYDFPARNASQEWNFKDASSQFAPRSYKIRVWGKPSTSLPSSCMRHKHSLHQQQHNCQCPSLENLHYFTITAPVPHNCSPKSHARSWRLTHWYKITPLLQNLCSPNFKNNALKTATPQMGCSWRRLPHLRTWAKARNRGPPGAAAARVGSGRLSAAPVTRPGGSGWWRGYAA